MFSCHYWGVHLLYLGMPCMLWYICLIFLYDLVFSCTLSFTIVSPCISWYMPLCILVYRHCYSGKTPIHSGTLRYALYALVHMSHVLVRSRILLYTGIYPCIALYILVHAFTYSCTPSLLLWYNPGTLRYTQVCLVSSGTHVSYSCMILVFSCTLFMFSHVT